MCSYKKYSCSIIQWNLQMSIETAAYSVVQYVWNYKNTVAYYTCSLLWMSLLWWTQKISSNWGALQVLLPSLSVCGLQHGLWLLLEFHHIFPLFVLLFLFVLLVAHFLFLLVTHLPYALVLVLSHCFFYPFSDFLLPTFNHLFAL